MTHATRRRSSCTDDLQERSRQLFSRVFQSIAHGHRSTTPLDLQRLEAGGPLWFVLVNPRFEAPTAEMRAVLPAEVPMASQIHNAAMGGCLVRSSARGARRTLLLVACDAPPVAALRPPVVVADLSVA